MGDVTDSDVPVEQQLAEEAAVALVREFLSQKGCKRTLATLDEEIPRSVGCIHNRAELTQTLHVAPLLRKNKSLKSPFRSIAEMITWDLIKHPRIWNENIRRPRPASARAKTPPSGKAVKIRPQSAGGIRTSHNPSVNLATLTEPQNTRSSLRNHDSAVTQATNSPELEKSPSNIPQTKKRVSLLDPEAPDPSDEKCVRWLTGEDDEILTTTDEVELSSQHPGRRLAFSVSKAPMGFETAASLRKLVFGSINGRIFSKAWTGQSLTFYAHGRGRNEKLHYGLMQFGGGPSGIIAIVQAYMIKHLIFCKEKDGHRNQFSDQSELKTEKNIRTNCLAEAIIEILWRAGSEQHAVLTLLNKRKSFIPPTDYRCDGMTERYVTMSCDSLDSLRVAVHGNINLFENGHGSVISLLYSVILSRGVSEIIEDMDGKTITLMGPNHTCTKEMLNLFIVGYAASTFSDKPVATDETGTYLQGISDQSEVGLLSLFEHNGCYAVGDNLKSPSYPIWIVASENHFGTLFSLDLEMLDNKQKVFDLFYYDGTSGDNEAKVTVDTTRVSPPWKSEEEVPFLELCIQTRWKKCFIHWLTQRPEP